jgi:hypothetical protein
MEGIRCAVKVFALSRDPLSLPGLKAGVSRGESDEVNMTEEQRAELHGIVALIAGGDGNAPAP